MTFSTLGIDTTTKQPVYLYQKYRIEGLTVIGLQRMGKSGLYEELILSDIKQGIGVCVLDPHGELVENVRARLDKSREKDVIFLDLLDAASPFGINILECSAPTDDDAITETVYQVTHVFEKAFGVSQAATPRIYDYLFYSAYTLIANPGHTLIDIPLLFDDACRQNLLANVTSPDVHKFWNDVKQLPQQEQSNQTREILRRFTKLFHAPLRNIVGQSCSTIDMLKIMDDAKILLIKLERKREEATSFIGSTLVALILNASDAHNAKIPFHLYADEFQNFATPDFAVLQEQAPKRNISVATAFQNLAQLELSDKQAEANLKHRTLSVGSLIVFRSPTYAHELAGQFDTTPLPSPTQTQQERVFITSNYPLEDFKQQRGHQNKRVASLLKRYIDFELVSNISSFGLDALYEEEKLDELYEEISYEEECELSKMFRDSLHMEHGDIKDVTLENIFLSLAMQGESLTGSQNMRRILRYILGFYGRNHNIGVDFIHRLYLLCPNPDDDSLYHKFLQKKFDLSLIQSDILMRFFPTYEELTIALEEFIETYAGVKSTGHNTLVEPTGLSMYARRLVSSSLPPEVHTPLFKVRFNYHMRQLHLLALQTQSAMTQAELAEEAFDLNSACARQRLRERISRDADADISERKVFESGLQLSRYHLPPTGYYESPLRGESSLEGMLRTQLQAIGAQLYLQDRLGSDPVILDREVTAHKLALGDIKKINKFIADWDELAKLLQAEPIMVATDRYEEKPVSRTFADMQNDIANQLRGLSKFIARVKTTDVNGDIAEYTMQTIKPGTGLYGKLLQDRIARIQAQNKIPNPYGSTRPRQDVETEIAKRQSQCSGGSSPAHKQKPQHPPQPQGRLMPICKKCGSQNQPSAKFCNQCGEKITP